MIKAGPIHINEYVLVYGILVGILMICAPFNRYNATIASSPVIHLLSKVFVNWGYTWCAILMAGLVGLSTRLWLSFAVNGIIGFCTNWWFFGPPIFDRINSATGGYCDGDSLIKDTFRCAQSGNVWLNGLDISSHCYLLGQYVILICFALVNLRIYPISDSESATYNPLPRNGQQILRALGWVLGTMFLAEYIITCVFFHTFAERVLGLFFGVLAIQAITLTTPK